MKRRDLLILMGTAAAGAGSYAFVPSFLRGDNGKNSKETAVSDMHHKSFEGAESDGKKITEEIRRLSENGEEDSSQKEDASADGTEIYRPGSGIEARHYKKLKNKSVHCKLCFHDCRISDGKAGACRIRENSGGKLWNAVYGLAAAVAVEPAEKEPMHHFLPGSNMLCIGTVGCNFTCRFCHNWHLSQGSPQRYGHRGVNSPSDIVKIAKARNVPSVSFTYNEPTVFYEYMYDIAAEARREGLRSIMHSNGGISPAPLKELLPFIDAVTIDFKAFSDDFYRRLCGGRLDPVLNTMKAIRKSGTWLEIVNLVIPGHNDKEGEIRELCRWIFTELGPDVPLHLSRFFPSFRMMNLSPTPVSTLDRCHSIALEEGLNFVSIGNLPGHEANSTFCPSCKTRIISRVHFTVSEMNMKDGACGNCGRKIPGVWK